MEKEEAIQKFVDLTQVPASVAEVLLARNNWDVEDAVTEFYNGPTQATREEPEPLPSQPTHNTQPQQKKSKSQPKFKSLSEMLDKDDNEDDDSPNLFAGGGRGSALNVEDPNNANNLVQDLLRKAERGEGHPSRMGEDDEAPPQPKFEGVGYQLGDSSTPSRSIGSNAPKSKRLEKAIREITFWKDGFQVGEGRLYRYDDPANATYLNELNSGRAPLSLLDVEYGQEVDVNVMKKLDEEYKPPKRKIGGFHGSGHRLGSPVEPGYTSPAPTVTESTPAQETKEQETPKEESKGDAQVQIRLADGRKVVRRIESTAPVQELYDFVAAETSSARAWSLNHAFPVKPIEDKQQSIKEAGLVNSVVVQRWT